jgi:hypothetical protein
MGTSTERREGAGLKAALCTGKPKSGALPDIRRQPESLTSKPIAAVFAVAVGTAPPHQKERHSPRPSRLLVSPHVFTGE